MDIHRAGGAMGPRVAAAAAALFLLLAGAVIAAAAGVGRPCFDACFDQCVPLDEFWFCQFSCYHRCSGGGRAVAAMAAATRGGEGDCEQACALSMCGQIDPESKMMAVCRDTCRKSYATEGCRRPSSSTSSAM